VICQTEPVEALQGPFDKLMVTSTINIQMLTAKTLRGNWATLLLPIKADDSIDWAILSDTIDYLLSVRPDGIYSNGTAGEFHNQTEAEFDRVQALLADKCRKAGIPFQIGASHPSPIISLERLKRTVWLQPDAFQVILPDWVAATAQEQVIFLQTIAAAAGSIPLVLYNPPHGKTVLQPADFRRLKDAIPALIGMKVAGGDAQWYADMRVQAHDLSVFVPGHFLATGVKEGVGAGAYSNIACLSPKGAQWWWQLMQTDINKALEVQQRILRFFDTCIVPFKEEGYSNPALDKFLAAIGGWGTVGTRLRWPYRSIAETEVAGAREIAKAMLPEFF
jgi:4-hydroxy-tetrahydrodipicolinate synthase